MQKVLAGDRFLGYPLAMTATKKSKKCLVHGNYEGALKACPFCFPEILDFYPTKPEKCGCASCVNNREEEAAKKV
jgi:hypothetical protein